MKLPGILSFAIALSLGFQASAFDSLAELYEGCSVAHVPVEKRTRDDHIKLRRCSAFLTESSQAARMLESITGPKPVPPNFFDRFDPPPIRPRGLFDDLVGDLESLTQQESGVAARAAQHHQSRSAEAMLDEALARAGSRSAQPIACPPSSKFNEGRRVMAFLNYWDRKGVPWRLLAPSPTSAAVEALAATYPECLKAAGQ